MKGKKSSIGLKHLSLYNLNISYFSFIDLLVFCMDKY